MTEIMKKVEDLVLFGNIEEVQEEEGVVAVKALYLIFLFLFLHCIFIMELRLFQIYLSKGEDWDIISSIIFSKFCQEVNSKSMHLFT
jgi:hypothetical protein